MASPIVDIDVDWLRRAVVPGRQNKVICLRIRRLTSRVVHVAVLVTNRRATVSQVRWFHFVSPDSRTGLPQLFPDHGNFVGSISCSRRFGDGDK